MIWNNFFCSGTIGSFHTLLKYIVEHLLNDETGCTHLDSILHLAVDRIIYIRVL